MRKNKLVAMMVVFNEGNRFLTRVLNHLSLWVDEIVILDDGSTDHTRKICNQYPKVFFVENDAHTFIQHEARLREKLWNITISRNPDWILAIDADEIFTDRILDAIDSYLEQKTYDAFAFRLFDFWKSENYYRVDGAWNPWIKFSVFLVRYHPEWKVTWPDYVIHSGRWPLEYRFIKNTFQSDIRVKHFGWARPEDHYRKYIFYCQKDLEQYGKIQPHTKSIMASNDSIILEKWFERKWMVGF